jgi:hypothetical protein
MTKAIDEIYKQRPSIIRNSIVIWVIKITAIVLMILFLGLGIGLLISPSFLFEAMEKLIVGDVINPEGTDLEQVKRLMYFFGILSLLGGIVMAILAYFSHLILVRNRFIKNLEGWFTNYYNSTQEEREQL